MNAKDVIKISMATADMIGLGYVSDLSDENLMRRPHAGCNHINWQLGHLIVNEHQLIEKVAPGSMPPLPAGMAEKYTKATASNNDPAAFLDKDTLLATHRTQRQGTLEALERVSDEQLGAATGIDYAPTVAAMFLLQADHWLMHCGQWVIVRRELGKAAMF